MNEERVTQPSVLKLKHVNVTENNCELMTGCYDPHAAKAKQMGRKVMPVYRDSVYTEKDNMIEVERQMMVGKQPIIVRSFFLTEASKTPTQKLLSTIDSNAEKVAI